MSELEQYVTFTTQTSTGENVEMAAYSNFGVPNSELIEFKYL